MGLFAEVQYSTLFALLALVITTGWLLWRSHRYLARQDKASSPSARTSRRRPPQTGPSLDAPDEMIRWEVQMHETARELSGQLDSKMAALSHLIREADRAASRLEAALASAADVPNERPPAQESTEQRSDVPENPKPLPSLPTDQAEALKSASAADRGSVARETAPEPGQSRPPADQRYEEVYLLADYGFDAPEIARRVGSPVGEVELILGLRTKQ